MDKKKSHQDGSTIFDAIMIFGAGLAGLSAACHLDDKCDVFEKADYVGGHCRTKRVDAFYFDEGGHVFFGNDDCSHQFVWKPLGAEMIPHQAEIWNNYGKRVLGRYPVQVNTHALPLDMAVRCVLDFVDSRGQEVTQVRTYEEWCRASLGKTLSEEFMFRYARKFWTVEPSELNTEWLGSTVGGRISRPSLEQVVRGAIDPHPQTLNYLTQFSYPTRGGFGRIVEPLASRVSRVRLGCGATQITAKDRLVQFSDGSMRNYRAAISTIPLPSLIRMTVDAPPEVRAAADRLMWTSVRCVNLGVARPDIGPGHWVYFYDEEMPFFRVSFPHRLSPHNAPAGHSAIACEIAYSRRKPLEEKGLVQRVIRALRHAGILRRSDKIVLEDQIDIPYAYVLFNFHRTPSLQTIHSWMESVGLYPCGRFGEWGYHWSFEAIESGRRVAARVAHDLGLDVSNMPSPNLFQPHQGNH